MHNANYSVSNAQIPRKQLQTIFTRLHVLYNITVEKTVSFFCICSHYFDALLFQELDVSGIQKWLIYNNKILQIIFSNNILLPLNTLF